MSVSESIRKRVQVRKALELFSFDHIAKPNESHVAIAKELSRMHANGIIMRLRNGAYYKPKISRFGKIKPSEKDVLNYLLFNHGKRVGYVSGARLYNSLGLTSQVSGVITIAYNREKRSGKFGGLRIGYVKSYGQIGKDDVYLMQLLDAIKDINKILDTSVRVNLNSIYQLILQLSSEEKKELVQIAQNYPPRVRAVVGAMMSNIWKTSIENKDLLENLRIGIVNTNRFEYPNVNMILNNTQDWYIYEPTST